MSENMCFSNMSRRIPLENPLEKSDDRAPLPMNCSAWLAFQWSVYNIEKKVFLRVCESVRALLLYCIQKKSPETLRNSQLFCFAGLRYTENDDSWYVRATQGLKSTLKGPKSNMMRPFKDIKGPCKGVNGASKDIKGP